MDQIVLSDEQLEAIQKIKEFLSSDETAFSLVGSAGTGKTLIMNKLVNDLKGVITVQLCAPTHKAKLVLQRSTGRECTTLHSLLALTPNLDIFELDFNELIFRSNSENVTIPRNGLVICDEASMINDDLFKTLIKRCSERYTKILFVSDEKQLRPVKSERESLVYTVKHQFRLTKIFRQSDKNALLPILEILRNKSIDLFMDAVGEEGSLICEYNLKEFLIKYLKSIKIALENKDILETKLATYTNKRVDLYNSLIKKALFPNGQEYNKTEFLTCCDNIEFAGMYQFWNSMDYIIATDPIRTTKTLKYFGDVEGWEFELYDPLDDFNKRIFILSKDNDDNLFNALAYKLDQLRCNAIKERNYQRKAAKWGMYYDLNKSFTTPIDLYVDGRLVKKKSFTEGYACTTHRLQGSTFNNIFIDMQNINSCKDDKVKQQLQYVALSRTRTDAILLQ
jgi:ATP-dependent exoDNAse (exonuclease V) alpha subunit